MATAYLQKGSAAQAMDAYQAALTIDPGQVNPGAGGVWGAGGLGQLPGWQLPGWQLLGCADITPGSWPFLRRSSEF